MRWSNKGHEFDEYAEKPVSNFIRKEKKIYLFGAGLIGKEILEIIKKTGCFAGFIDNDSEKQSFGAHGVNVISPQCYLDNGSRGIIVITADEKNSLTIEKQLSHMGLEREKDFYGYKSFMRDIFPVLSIYANNQLYVELAQICLTERCTLKCRKCAHACYAVHGKNQDMKLNTAMESADFFFRHIDIVKEFVLIGGEPFLYSDLGEIIAYIGEKYREKIVVLSITTNGTMIPKQNILDLCKKYDVTIRISNYSAVLKGLKERYTQLIEVLKKNEVLYTISGEELQWMDYGFETEVRTGSEEDLVQVFDSCKTPCREIRGSHYHYCVMARSVSDNLKLGVGKEDYLDLLEMHEEDKKILWEFQMGFSEKGYLEMCKRCRGAEAKKYPIPAAEQVKKPDKRNSVLGVNE